MDNSPSSKRKFERKRKMSKTSKTKQDTPTKKNGLHALLINHSHSKNTKRIDSTKREKTKRASHKTHQNRQSDFTFLLSIGGFKNIEWFLFLSVFVSLTYSGFINSSLISLLSSPASQAS